MTMAGGATVGYCDTGNLLMAAPPNSTMNSAMTQAKIGRSMKNPESMRLPPNQRLAAGAGGVAAVAAAAAPAAGADPPGAAGAAPASAAAGPLPPAAAA